MTTADRADQSGITAVLPSDRRQALLNLLLVAAWGWLYWPLTAYLTVIFTRQDFRTNQIILIGVLILIAMQIQKEGLRIRLDAPPHRRPLPLTLALGGAVAYLLVERFLDVNTVAASLFGLASYGLLGLWLSPARWRGGLPAALLLIGTLPFGAHLQTFVGYPMRIATAALVQDGLAAVGVSAIGIDTILVFENGVSQVDLPCSGVQSLWTGTLFLLAATWIERRPLNLRWGGTAVLFAALLFIANLTRVAVLVTVGEVLGWRLTAEMLHVPLGVLGFIAACTAAVLLLRKQTVNGGQYSVISKQVAEESTPLRNTQYAIRNTPFRLPFTGHRLPFTGHRLPFTGHRLPFTDYHSPFTILLIAAVALMALLYTPRPQTGLTTAPPAWDFPAEMAIEPLPLKPDEYEWLTRDGAESADRLRFEWGDLSGSMILITSKTWRAHHRPERCFEVYGLALDNSQTQLVAPTMPVRLVTISDDDRQVQLSAGYWFQTAVRTTDDYATRIWADLAPQRQRWVLVSVLFDGPVAPDDAAAQEFYQALHHAVAAGLNNGEP